MSVRTSDQEGRDETPKADMVACTGHVGPIHSCAVLPSFLVAMRYLTAHKRGAIMIQEHSGRWLNHKRTAKGLGSKVKLALPCKP